MAAAVRSVSWLMGTLIVKGGGMVGGQMSTVIAGALGRAFYATLIVTPVLGILAVFLPPAMFRATKVWTLAGLLAGVKWRKDANDAYSLFL